MHAPRPAPAPVRRSSRLPRGARRAQLLQAAQEVFVANGFHAAAMDEIADRAGVSKPVLYQHFPGKRELYLALLEQQVTLLTDRVREAMEGTDDNRTRVNGAVGAYFDFINADGAAFRLVFESDLNNDDDVRELADRGHRACVEAIGEVIAADTGLDREQALYVHGLGGASTNWTDLAALLAVRFDGWALDLPGFGRSRPPARTSYSVRGHVAAVVDVLERIVAEPGEAAGRPVHLLGNSLGGLVALFVAASRPDLVATLTLVSPAMPVYRVPSAFSRTLLLLLLPGIPALAERRLSGVTPEQQLRGMVQMCFGDPRRVPRVRLEQALEEMRERAEQPWATQALTRSMRGLITSYLRVGPRNAWRLARALRPPTLVVWGDRDRLVDPALAPRLAAAVPDARLLVLEGVGHVAMLETPEPTARAVLALAEDAAEAALDHGDQVRAS